MKKRLSKIHTIWNNFSIIKYYIHSSFPLTKQRNSSALSQRKAGTGTEEREIEL